MVTYGYVMQHEYRDDGTLMVKVRIPSIHGPYSQLEYSGQKIRNYVRDDDLPWYPSVLLTHIPNKGDVIALLATSEANREFIVLGLTGSSYSRQKGDI